MKPHLIKFNLKENPTLGSLSIAEHLANVPFEIKRVFWTYHTPDGIIRGHHAHKATQQILIALQGEIVVKLKERDGSAQEFVLNDPNVGLFIPPTSWHTMTYRENAIQLVFASELYDENDYIRSFEDYMNTYE